MPRASEAPPTLEDRYVAARDTLLIEFGARWVSRKPWVLAIQKVLTAAVLLLSDYDASRTWICMLVWLVTLGFDVLEARTLRPEPGADVRIAVGTGIGMLCSGIASGLTGGIASPVVPSLLVAVVIPAAAFGNRTPTHVLLAELVLLTTTLAVLPESIVGPAIAPGYFELAYVISMVFAGWVAVTNLVALTEVYVLLRGATGTGKELVATLIHVESARREAPLVRFNCAAVPADLAEDELFGHAKGAFTGAVGPRKGYFAQAHGGTLVLDEIAELPLSLQPKLLRALQEGEIQPVGGRVEKVVVRVVASTHRDLLEGVRSGRFREDLYYRLAVVELVVPTLEKRREEIPTLARALAARWSERFDVPDVQLSPELLDALQRSSWPGNVRQLENTVARMIALHGASLGLKALHGAMHAADATAPGIDSLAEGAEPEASDVERNDIPLREQVDAFERGVIGRVLGECGQNQSRAARRLAIGRATLIDKMKKHGLR